MDAFVGGLVALGAVKVARSAPRRGLTLTASWFSRIEEGSATSRTLAASLQSADRALLERLRGRAGKGDSRSPHRFDRMTATSELMAEFRERFAQRLASVSGLEPMSPLADAVLAAGLDALADVEHARAGRRRCVLCGEPIVLCDPDDPESWVHAEDAGDWGDHSAEIEGTWLGNGRPVVGEGVAGERLA